MLSKHGSCRTSSRSNLSKQPKWQRHGRLGSKTKGISVAKKLSSTNKRPSDGWSLKVLTYTAAIKSKQTVFRQPSGQENFRQPSGRKFFRQPSGHLHWQAVKDVVFRQLRDHFYKKNRRSHKTAHISLHVDLTKNLLNPKMISVFGYINEHVLIKQFLIFDVYDGK